MHLFPYLLIGGCLGVTGVLGRRTLPEDGGGGGTGGAGGGGGGLKCVRGELAVYRVEVTTAWSRQVFPKQYPEWRPPAQWSKVLGRSHNASYKLFRMSEAASEGLKQFAEVGQSELLDAETPDDVGVLDQFTAPPIPRGVGDTHAQFFVDGNHSRVSLISRVVPSPDWFIGVDSFDLCVEGKWMESVVLEVDPLDAGTDKGFTFTSPNWPTIPRKPVTRITAQNPNHPANSFYYPEVDSHPPIATFRLSKIKEYNLAKVFTPPSSPSLRYSSSDLARRRRPRPRNSATQTETETRVENIAEENEEPTNAIRGSRNIGVRSGIQSGDTVEPRGRNAGGKKTLLNTIVNKYKKYRRNRRGRKMGEGRRAGMRRRRLGQHRHMRAPRDCRVTEWEEWSSCSKTCGIGEQMRTRAVLRPSRGGGSPCPALQETKWCGSYRDCDLPHFAW